MSQELQAGLMAGLRILKKTGGACVKLVPKNSADEPLAALIVVTGKAETAEFLKAIEAIESKW